MVHWQGRSRGRGGQRHALPAALLVVVVWAGVLVGRTAATFPWEEDWGSIFGKTHPPTMAPTPSPTQAPTAPPGCSSSDQCGSDRVCVFPTGSCAPPGTCIDRPAVCPADFEPVCGCNGRTYSNPCKAQSAGESIRYQGPCGQGRRAQAEAAPAPSPVIAIEGAKCGGSSASSSSCLDAGQYCEFEHGSCGDGGLQGRCSMRPTVCTLEYMPFCGCDGKTYGNRCAARAAGVSIRFQGECGQGSTPAAAKQLRGEGWGKDLPRKYHQHQAGEEVGALAAAP